MALCSKEFHENALSQTFLARLRSLDRTDVRYVKVPDNLGGEIGATLLGTLALLAIPMHIAITPAFYANAWFWIAVVAAPLLLRYGTRTLRLRMKARLKMEAVYVDDEFIFQIRPQYVRVWALALCTDVKATHTLRNGVYAGTRMDCTFVSDRAETLSFDGSMEGGRAIEIASLIHARRKVARATIPESAVGWSP